MFNSSELMNPLNVFSECFDISAEAGDFPIQADGYYDVKMIFLHAGALSVQLDGEEYSLCAGDLLMICPDTAFSLTAAPGEMDTRATLIRMDAGQLYAPPWASGWSFAFREAKRQGMPMRIPAETTAQWRMDDILSACAQEEENRQAAWELMIVSELSRLSILAMRFWAEKGLKLRSHGAEEDPMNTVTAYIQRHILEGIRVEEIASRCNLSYPWFAKRFREIYGISCKEYIEQVRVARVEQLLRYTDLDLAEISDITGYADCSHMIKNFKRLKNMTPGRYRGFRKA